jgi:hypothetical protein
MAGFATRPSFAGHADRGAKTNHELTSIPDHLMGADQTAQLRMPLHFSDFFAISLLLVCSPAAFSRGPFVRFQKFLPRRTHEDVLIYQ